MPAMMIDVDPIAPSDRANYTRHDADEVTEQFAADLEPLLVANDEDDALTPEELTHGWWIGRADQVQECVTHLVGVAPNGLLSRYIPEIGGVWTWTQATWRAVPGLVVSITWRTLWPTDLPDAPLSVIKPDYDFQMWVPLSEDARLCAALGFPT